MKRKITEIYSENKKLRRERDALMRRIEFLRATLRKFEIENYELMKQASK